MLVKMLKLSWKKYVNRNKNWFKNKKISLFELVKTSSKAGPNTISGEWNVSGTIPNVGRDLND
jgi:hypothetical protein